MKEPPKHPGELLVTVLKKLGRSQRWLAGRAELSTKHVNQICTGVVGISARSAVRFEEAIGIGAETWMALQAHHDIAVAREERREAREFERLLHESSLGQAREEAERALRAALPVLGSIEPYRRPG